VEVGTTVQTSGMDCSGKVVEAQLPLQLHLCEYSSVDYQIILVLPTVHSFALGVVTLSIRSWISHKTIFVFQLESKSKLGMDGGNGFY